MSVDVELPRSRLRFPTTCPSCGAPATAEVRLFQYQPWDAVHVPVCPACKPKLFGGLVLRRVVILALATAGAIAAQELLPGWLVATFPDAERARSLFQFLWVAGAFVGGFPAAIVFHVLFPPRLDVSLDKKTVTFECLDEAWAAELERLNARPDDESHAPTS